MHILAYLGFGFILIFKTGAAPTFSVPVDGAACTLASIAEGSTGTTVPDTIVTAAASGVGTITFILVAGHADTPQFDMTAGVVTLKTTAAVDYDARENKFLMVQIEATDDDDSAKATASCTVAITDIQPGFTAHIVPYSFRLSKDVAVGAAVGAFPCFDGGQGDFTYQLSETHTYFEMSEFALATKASLASVAAGTLYTLTIQCTDATTITSQAVTICIDSFDCGSGANLPGISSALVALVLYFIHKLF